MPFIIDLQYVVSISRFANFCLISTKILDVYKRFRLWGLGLPKSSFEIRFWNLDWNWQVLVGKICEEEKDSVVVGFKIGGWRVAIERWMIFLSWSKTILMSKVDMMKPIICKMMLIILNDDEPWIDGLGVGKRCCILKTAWWYLVLVWFGKGLEAVLCI